MTDDDRSRIDPRFCEMGIRGIEQCRAALAATAPPEPSVDPAAPAPRIAPHVLLNKVDNDAANEQLDASFGGRECANAWVRELAAARGL